MRGVSLRRLAQVIIVASDSNDKIDKSINKLQIVQTVHNVQNWWKTDEEKMKS